MSSYKKKKKIVPAFWVLEAGSTAEVNALCLDAQLQGYSVEAIHRHADSHFQNYEIVLRHGKVKKK